MRDEKGMDNGVIDTPSLSLARNDARMQQEAAPANATLLHTAARRATAATGEQIHFRGHDEDLPGTLPSLRQAAALTLIPEVCVRRITTGRTGQRRTRHGEFLVDFPAFSRADRS